MPKPGEVYRVVNGKEWTGYWQDSLIVLIQPQPKEMEGWTIRSIFPVYGWDLEWADVSVGFKDIVLVGFLEHIPDEWYPPPNW